MAKLQDIQANIMRLAAQRQQQLQQPQYPVVGSNAVQPMQEVHDVIQIKQPVYTAKPTLPSPTPNVSIAVKKTDEPNIPAAASNTDEYATKVNSVLKALIKDKDYMQINGIKDPIITRSGLIKILRGMNYRYNSKLVDKQIVDGIITYTIEITVADSEGCYICSALGSSNSGEKKFADKGLSSDNILTAIASTRALRSCIKDILVR